MSLRLVGILVALLLIAGGAVFVRSAFPVLWGMDGTAAAEQASELEAVDLSNPTLFISDFHFRIGDENLRFDIPLEEVTSIVIVGDLFHSPDDYHWFDDAETNEERIGAALRTFLPEDYDGAVYWVSALDHDPQDLPPMRFQMGDVDVHHVGAMGRFTVGDTEIVAVHGDRFFRGWGGGGLSWLSRSVGFPLPLERAARGRLDLSEETWLITGHSHVPAIHQDSRTANTGSFAGVPFNSVFRVHVGTGILFAEGGAELQEYEGIEPTLFP